MVVCVRISFHCGMKKTTVTLPKWNTRKTNGSIQKPCTRAHYNVYDYLLLALLWTLLWNCWNERVMFVCWASIRKHVEARAHISTHTPSEMYFNFIFIFSHACLDVFTTLLIACNFALVSFSSSSSSSNAFMRIHCTHIRIRVMYVMLCSNVNTR